jgi:hypothetical protein
MSKSSYFQFLLLSTQEKRQYLEETGSLLLQYPNEKGDISLYALDNFFVELQCDEQKKTIHIVSFKNPHCLEGYIQHIKQNSLET